MALNMELEYRLRWMDFDRFGRIQPTAVLDLFQDAATKQANEMGIGRDDMMKGGVFWAVIRSKFEIVSEPQHFQVVKIKTWPHTPTRFSFMRDFTMRDASTGELLIKASTEWVLMDIETRKFASVKDHYAGPMDFDEERAFEGKLKKVANFEEGNRPELEVVPRYSDIDANGHVNNARYANYAIDALNPIEGGRLKTFQIDYRHEVFPGAPIVVHTLVDGQRILSKGINETGDIAFACMLEAL